MKKIRSYIFDLRSILVAYFFLIYQLLKIVFLVLIRFFYNQLKQKESQPHSQPQPQPQPQPQSQPQPQTIIHINTFDKGGGAAEIAFSLMEEQLKKGIKSYLIVGTKKTDHPNVIEIPKVNTKLKSYFQNANKILQWQDLLLYDSLYLNKIDVIKKADVIHLHNLHGGYFSIFSLLSIRKKKIIWTLHDMHAFTGNCAHSFSCNKWITGCGGCENLNTYPKLERDTTSFLWKVRAFLFKSLTIKVVAPSNWLLQKVKESYLGRKDNLLIYNGIDTSIYKPIDKAVARMQLNIPLDKKVILFSAELGSKNIYKGGKYIEKLIQDSRLKSVLFINVGGGSEIVKKGNIWSFPYIQDKREMAVFYSAADVFVYPSLADNCPLVVLEVMACGLPIVTFNTGGIPELLTMYKRSFLARANFYEELFEGVYKMFSQEYKLQHYINFYSLKKIEQEYFNLYLNAI